jgi:hypothetical protein
VRSADYVAGGAREGAHELVCRQIETPAVPFRIPHYPLTGPTVRTSRPMPRVAPASPRSAPSRLRTYGSPASASHSQIHSCVPSERPRLALAHPRKRSSAPVRVYLRRYGRGPLTQPRGQIMPIGRDATASLATLSTSPSNSEASEVSCARQDHCGERSLMARQYPRLGFLPARQSA